MPRLSLTSEPQRLAGTQSGVNYSIQSQTVGVVLLAASVAAPSRGFRLFSNEIEIFKHGSGESLWAWSIAGNGTLVWAEAPATGGGGALLQRNPADVFTGATLAAAQAARNAYFSDAANADALAEFQANPFLTITLDPSGNNNNVFETYSSGQEGQAYDASQWLERTGFIRGPEGPEGPDGPPASNDQIDARVRTVVADEALDSNTDRWPLAKIPTIGDIVAAFDAAIGTDWRTGGGGGGGAPADGVVTSGAWDAATTSIVLRISNGNTVSISLGPLLAAISQNLPPPLPDATEATVNYELQVGADGQARWVVAQSGGDTPVQHASLYFGTSADRDPTAGELTVQGVAGSGTIPAYAGDRHVLIARLASEADITRVMRSDDVSGTNQIGAFTKHGSTVNIGGVAYSVWVSNQALTQAANVSWSAG